MLEWWNALQLYEQIFFCIAIPSTLVIIIQTILLMLGAGHGGEGVNISDTGGLDLDTSGDIGDIGDIGDFSDGCSHTDITGDGSSPGDFGAMQIFTLQGIMTFLCVFGWTGVVCSSLKLHIALCIIIALVLGVLAMLGVAKVLQLSGKLAHNGNIDMKKLLGEKGSVYIPVPAGESGQGKITVNSGERYVEFSAITEDEKAIPTGTQVRIVDIRGELLVVEKDI